MLTRRLPTDPPRHRATCPSSVPPLRARADILPAHPDYPPWWGRPPDWRVRSESSPSPLRMVRTVIREAGVVVSVDCGRMVPTWRPEC